MSESGRTIGLIGCGRWGRNILRDLIALDCRVAVAALCAESHANAVQGGAALIVDHIGALPEVSGFIVASPATTHAAVLGELLARGAPIFCEKPLTDDVAAARRLAALAADQLFVMDKWRYHPGILELARIGRSGELGQVQGLCTQRLGWSLPQTDVDCSWTLLPHELTIALEILGRIPTPRQAVAARAADGSLASLTALLAGPCWHRTAIGIDGPSRPRRVELHCTDGVACLPDADSNHIILTRSLQSRTGERRPIPVEPPLLAELRVFLNHLRGGPAPRSSVGEAVAVVETIDAIRRLAGLTVPNGASSHAG